MARRSDAARSLTSRAISATGWSVPISLLASITLTKVVSGLRAAATSSGRTTPSRPGRTYEASQPSVSSSPTAFRTAWCSMLLTTTWRPSPLSASAAPMTAALSDSVPPLVNTTSPGRAPSTAAHRSRASSIACRACWASA